MSFVVVGLNHTTAPLDVLEQVTVSGDDLPKALHDLSSGTHLSESIVLSTCNRTEIYVEAERFHGAFQDVRDVLARLSTVAPERLGDCLYTFYDEHAVSHLFRVAAGVDSVVVGEHEILGQVKRAWQVADEHDCVGANLHAVFRAALEAGKRVRTETGIARHVASVSQAAVVLAEDRLASTGGLANAHVLLVGAGEMGTGMALSVADRTPRSITVMSRTIGTAQALTERLSAGVRPFDELDDALVDCDVAFMSTAAPSMVLDAAHAEAIMAARGGRPLVIVDVAMPRDVDPAVASIPNVVLCDLDSVGAFVAEGLEQRSGELADAERIVNEEVLRFGRRVGEQSVAPIITQFRRRAEDLRHAELDRLAPRLADLTPEQRDAVDEVTKSVLNKLLHEPTIRLKDTATSLRGERLAAAMRDLFDLD